MSDTVTTKEGEQIPLNIQHAIMIKDAMRSVELLELLRAASAEGLSVHAFTREMLETTNDKKVAAATAEKNLDEVEFLGVLVFGESSAVEALTNEFPLSA